MQIQAVHVYQIRHAGSQCSAELVRERATLVFVIGVRAPADNTAQVVPHFACSRPLVGNRSRLDDGADDGAQRVPRRLVPRPVGVGRARSDEMMSYASWSCLRMASVRLATPLRGGYGRLCASTAAVAARSLGHQRARRRRREPFIRPERTPPCTACPHGPATGRMPPQSRSRMRLVSRAVATGGRRPKRRRLAGVMVAEQSGEQQQTGNAGLGTN